jgi:CheY-like chemotaxis protein
MPSFFDRIGRLLGKESSDQSSASASRAKSTNGDAWRPRVLCVDDDDAVLKLLHRQLSGTYDVTIAHSGSEGIVALQEQPPFDVIVSDLKMRQVSGLAFLQRAQEIAPETARIILTGFLDPTTKATARSAGRALKMLTKPYDVRELRAAIDEGVALRRSNPVST